MNKIISPRANCKKFQSKQRFLRNLRVKGRWPVTSGLKLKILVSLVTVKLSPNWMKRNEIPMMKN